MQLLGSSLLALAVLLASSFAVRKVVISEAHSKGEANKLKCKNWCKKQAISFGQIPSMEEFKRLANAKCTQRDCKGCTGKGATCPDCQKKAEIVMDSKAIEVRDVQVVKAEMGDEVQPCTAGGFFSTSKPCSFGKGEICSHIDAAWCTQPSTNAGQQFRYQGKQPLCCFDEEASNMDSVEKNVAEVVESMSGEEKEEDEKEEEKTDDQDEKEKDDEEEKEVPAKDEKEEEKKDENDEKEKDDEEEKEVSAYGAECAVAETFGVDSFKIRGKTVNRCRSSTGFAPKACCDPAAFKLAESQEHAQKICKTVKKSFCKPHGLTKRKKAKGLPITHGCKRMYMCVAQGQEGEEGYGPVESRSKCTADQTLLGKDREARRLCVAYRL